MILPDLNVYASAAMFVLGAYLIAVYLGLVVWTFRDIRARSRDLLGQIMATLLVVVFNLPGLLVYLLVRPHTTLAEEYDRSLTEEAVLHDLDDNLNCPGCQRRVQADFVICPHCHQQLRLRCVDCGRLLDLSWDVCPFCGRIRVPAGRDVSPALAPGVMTTPTEAPEADLLEVVEPGATTPEA